LEASIVSSREPSGEDRVLNLVAAIYDAALDATLWPDLLIRFGDALGSPQIMFGFYDAATGLTEIHAPGVDPDVARSCAEWGAGNPLPGLSAAEPPGKVFSISDFLAPDAFKRTAFYQEWWRPHGWSLEPMTTNLMVDGHAAAILSISKAQDQPAFDSGDKRLFATLAKHLVRAVELQRRLYPLTLASENALIGLDRLPQGLMLVDAEARLVFANGAARALLDTREGLCLEQGAVVCARDADAAQTLCGMIAACATEPGAAAFSGGEVALRRGNGRLPLDILIMPVKSETAIVHMSWTRSRRPTAVLIVSDPETEMRTRAELLRGRFGFTPAEAAFALEIIKGDGRQAAADRLGITVGTARSHLSRIFDKTGSRRQAELVRLLLDV
jgi:DNA-binding CsgD family transcriptional regulator